LKKTRRKIAGRTEKSSNALSARDDTGHLARRTARVIVVDVKLSLASWLSSSTRSAPAVLCREKFVVPDPCQSRVVEQAPRAVIEVRPVLEVAEFTSATATLNQDVVVRERVAFPAM
jgi:hypothetical protein